MASNASQTTPPDNQRVTLPGFGRGRLDDFRDGGQKAMFGHALSLTSQFSHGLAVRERRMMQFIDAITDKPDWQRKVFDDAIVGKWRKEIAETPAPEGDEVFMSDKMADYCFAELRDKAKRFSSVGFVDVYDASVNLVKSDTAVSDELAASLRKHVAVLEDVPAYRQDWHPGSDGKVLDLLHPSLFPVVFGRTRALANSKVPLDRAVEYTGAGELTSTEVGTINTSDGFYGLWTPALDSYQWLPSDVVLSSAGASISSYINNLHPTEHRELYGVLEKFVAAAVPLWEECLSSQLRNQHRLPISETDDEEDYYFPDGVRYPRIPRPDGNGFHGDGNGDADSTGIPGSDEDDDYKWEDPQYEQWNQDNRILRQLEPGEFVPFDERPLGDYKGPTSVSLATEFPDGLQVIFKLANIHLTPEKPAYDGGSWHIEGTLAEYICASAIYYYDEENITPSRLAFRHILDADDIRMIPAQSAFNSLEAYLGITADGAAIQELGSVLTRSGRLLAFPNILQHRVGEFRLQDPTKPGHRKILAMFLVDPHRRILSTGNVPPQQKDWWSPLVRNVPSFQQLPPELFAHVMDSVDSCPMSWDDALEIREDLMAKRAAVANEYDDAVNCNEFSFCEH